MRYNATFTIEKDGVVQNKFEVYESDTNNREYIANLIMKKYKDFSITIKKISLSINGRGNEL